MRACPCGLCSGPASPALDLCAEAEQAASPRRDVGGEEALGSWKAVAPEPVRPGQCSRQGVVSGVGLLRVEARRGGLCMGAQV